MTDRIDRIRGCLYGGAAGDALGWNVEFDHLFEIFRRYGPHGIIDHPAGPAEITDDTQMTLFSIEAIATMVRLGDVSVLAAGELAYGKWYRTQIGPVDNLTGFAANPLLQHTRAPGGTCMGALSRRSPVATSKGCGGVMRTAPAGLFGLPDPYKVGYDLAGITHGHEDGKAPAGALAYLIDQLMRGRHIGPAVVHMITHLNTVSPDSETLRLCRLAYQLQYEPDLPYEALTAINGRGGGWTGDEALAIAIWCALRPAHDDIRSRKAWFSRALTLAANHDGDSDSTASIAGQIVGAWVGLDQIASRWWTPLKELSVIEEGARMVYAVRS